MLSLGHIIKKYAEQKRKSLVNVEIDAGISKNHIYAIMRNNDCQLSILKRIAEVLEIPMWEFFHDSRPFEERELATEKELLESYREIKRLNEIIKQISSTVTPQLNKPETEYVRPKKNKTK